MNSISLGPRLRPDAFCRRSILSLALVFASGVAVPTGVSAQDVNILFPVDYIMERLSAPDLRVVDMAQARPLISGDRSAQVMLAGAPGEVLIMAHWKPVRPPGEGFNNEPRYEMAAFRFQQLFLDQDDWVVPPKVLRATPFEEYEGVREERSPTIRGTRSFIFILAYWLQEVTNADPYDPRRFDEDPEYARRWGNVNLLTHLIDHKDANIGNLLISADPAHPRIFSVDNDVAWRSRTSDQGNRWSRLLVDRLPEAAVERLRALTRDDLDEALGVVAEFEIVDGLLEPVEPGPNLDAGRGVRVTSERVQFGLTRREINDTENRIRSLLQNVDRGRITLF